MFKMIVLMMVYAVYGVASSPTVLFSKPIVIQDDLKNTGPAHLPGVPYLAEKTSARIESQQPTLSSSDSHVLSFSPLPGTRNNAERIQIEPVRFRGTENLAEKAIPEAVIVRMFQKHVK